MKIQTQHIKNTDETSSSKEIVWHDVQGTYEEFAQFLNTLSTSQKACDIALENQRFPEVKIVSSCIILKLPIRNDWNISKSSYITFLILSNQLITFHHDHIQFFVQINEKITQDDEEIDEYSITSLMTYIIDTIVEINMHCFASARIAIETLNNKLDDPSIGITEKEIISTRRKVSRLLSQFEDQFYALTSLRTQHTKKLDTLDLLCAKIKDSTEAQGHLVRSLNRLEVRLRDLQQSYLYIMERKTEQRIRLLAILSTIYMPLTLITGIYGMNFTHMPGLSFEYGYYSIVAFMVIITSAQLYFFYHKGWFK